MEITTTEALAKLLDGHNLEEGMTKFVLKIARENKLVIVSAIGDDVVVFNGAFSDEVDCFRGGKIFMDKDGTYTKQSLDRTRKEINVFWEKNRTYLWKFLTLIPHHKYSIKREGRNFCEGIIFSMNDI